MHGREPMQHTPGPWWWEDWDEDGGPHLQTLVARPETRPDGAPSMFPTLPHRILRIEDDDTSFADKALIAAVTDLLVACEAACSVIPDRNPVKTQIRAAIAKARTLAAAPEGE